MFETRPGPEQRRPLHNTGKFDRLSVNDPLTLHLVDEFHESLVALVVLQVVRIHQYLHLVLEVLFERCAVGLRFLDQIDGLFCPPLFDQMTMDLPSNLLLLLNTDERFRLAGDVIIRLSTLSVKQLAQVVVNEVDCAHVKRTCRSLHQLAALAVVPDGYLPGCQDVNAQLY